MSEALRIQPLVVGVLMGGCPMFTLRIDICHFVTKVMSICQIKNEPCQFVEFKDLHCLLSISRSRICHLSLYVVSIVEFEKHLCCLVAGADPELKIELFTIILSAKFGRPRLRGRRGPLWDQGEKSWWGYQANWKGKKLVTGAICPNSTYL